MKIKQKNQKTLEEIENQKYISANDLQILTGFTYMEALKVIQEIRVLMKEKNKYLPKGRKKLALLELAKKFLGI